MVRDALMRLLNLLVPPRRTEALVAMLALDDLHALRDKQGLPYHQEEVAALVWELKYYGSSAAATLAGEYVAEELLAIASEELGQPLLVPIPMHHSRLMERGHNHTELLCEAALVALGDIPEKKSSGLPSRLGAIAGQTIFSETSPAAYEYAPRALKRIKMTVEQQKLSRENRLNNLKNSMEANSSAVKGRACVVVDDVTTTGATFEEAARALKAAGAAKVTCIALAQS